MRKFFLLGAAVLVASSINVSTAAAEGLGFGYLYQTHPVGIFYDMGGSYLHGGLRYQKNDENGSSSIETEFGVAGSWMMDMKSGEAWGFGPSVGVAFTSLSPQGDGDSATLTHISIGCYGHWNPVSALSFWMGSGLGIDLFSPGGDGESTTDFGLMGANVADLGFTYWMD